MKAQELRIGNLIYWNIPEKKDTIHTVVGMRNDTPQTMPISLGESIDDYKPIPLTEELLLKFGFKKVSGEWRLFPCFEIQIIVFNDKHYNGVMFYTRTAHADYSPIYCTNHINHVHEVQNLYYALTKKELTL